MKRLIAAAGGIAAALLALTGCTAPAPAPTVTTTVTATVTAPPAPQADRSPDDEVTALDAWQICYALTLNTLDPADWEILPYDPADVAASPDGGFTVTVPFAPASGQEAGGQTQCTVGGTLGAPAIDFTGPIDFG